MPSAGTGSWLNAAETFFSALTRRRLERGDFRSTVELQAAINRCLAARDRAPGRSSGPGTPTRASPK
jgi:hypothetical protein